MLSTLRLVVNSQGIPEAVQAGETETLRTLVLPLAVNAGEEGGGGAGRGRRQPALDAQCGRGGRAGGLCVFCGGSAFQIVGFCIQNVLQGQSDERGDKYAGLVQSDWGDVFYISGPIYDEQNQVGGGAVGWPSFEYPGARDENRKRWRKPPCMI